MMSMKESVKLLRLSGENGSSLARTVTEHLLRLQSILVFIAILQVRGLAGILHGCLCRMYQCIAHTCMRHRNRYLMSGRRTTCAPGTISPPESMPA